jgi:toxin CptA
LNESLRVQLRPSRALAIAIVVGHLLALAAAFVGLPPVAAGFATAGLALSLVHYSRWATHRGPSSVAALELWSDGRLAVAGPAGAWRPAALRHAAVPAGWLAILVARDDAGRSRSAVILPDALDAEPFRRLRVMLRWRATPEIGSPQEAIDDGRR